MNREQWEIKRVHHPEVKPVADGADGAEEPKRQRRNVSERRKKKKPMPMNNVAATN